jgi:acetolactate synthase-1/2/3 large subunit
LVKVILGQAEENSKHLLKNRVFQLDYFPLPTEHPLNVGMLGMHGNYGPNVLTNDCDVLIAIGMRFDDALREI